MRKHVHMIKFIHGFYLSTLKMIDFSSVLLGIKSLFIPLSKFNKGIKKKVKTETS